MLSAKAQTALNTVIDRFRTGDLSPIADIAMIRPHPDDHTPAHQWSLANRLIAYLQTGQLDCRGFRQWQQVDRHVVKGAAAAYILAPLSRKIADKDTGEEKIIVRGFRPIPVFPVTATDGEPLPVFDYRPAQLPPLQEAARRLGLKTAYLPSDQDATRGSYSPAGKEIRLYTHNAKTWFHELAHAAHDTLEALHGGQDAHQETVAEFTAAVLMHLYGFPDQTGNTWRYIESYNPNDPLTAIYKALSTVEKVLAVLLA